MSKKKTLIYWIGLILITASASLLFIMLWMLIPFEYLFPAGLGYYHYLLKNRVPFVVCAIAFLYIGLHMMREGVYDEVE